MRYGFYLPTRGPTATREGILALAREGERLGLHSAMIADHIVFPVESESAYPYTVDRKHPGGGDALETFSILGVVAGATERLRLVTSVLVLPYRNPVLTAKMVASLDVLSGGRVTLGVGVGWLKEEFEAMHSPDFDRRGAVTDEWIAIFKQLWRQSPASFAGQFYGVRKVWRQLEREGHAVARRAVARLIRTLGLRGVLRSGPVRTTIGDKAVSFWLGHVHRQFKAARPNALWLSDFTYVATWTGVVYVAFVVDAYARRIVG